MSKVSFVFLLLSTLLNAKEPELIINSDMPYLESLYLDLHQHPELSYREKETSHRLGKELAQLGFTVTKNIGGFGVVALLKNGEGPTLMIRTDTDALPITEQTGKPYASKVRTIDLQNNEVGVMHGCGHDIHMTSFIGTARKLVNEQSQWKGTLMMVAQPAEEVGAGAKAMLQEGLFSEFALPDAVLGLHVSADLESGKVAVPNDYALASVDSVDIIVKGKGGHGAYPHTTIDPIVLASRIVLALQTITSREVTPLEPSVLTIGSIHGGTKHNIISDEVKLQLTLRSYNSEVRDQQIAAIKRLTAGIALSAGLDDSYYPQVIVHEEESIPSTINHTKLAQYIKSSISIELGQANVITADPVMAGEDFGLYGRTKHQIPITLFWLGSVEPSRYKNAKSNNETLPSLHSSLYAPDYSKTIETGVRAMSAAALHLFNLPDDKRIK